MLCLLKLLGPAPNEKPFPLLLERIEKERTRVREAINLWRSGVALKPFKEKKLASRKVKRDISNEYDQMQNLLKSLGVK